MPASLPVNQISSPDRDHARPVKSLHSRVSRLALPARSVTATVCDAALAELAARYELEVPKIRGFGSFTVFAEMYVAACEVLRTPEDLRRLVDETVEVEIDSSERVTATGCSPG